MDEESKISWADTITKHIDQKFQEDTKISFLIDMFKEFRGETMQEFDRVWKELERINKELEQINKKFEQHTFAIEKNNQLLRELLENKDQIKFK